MIYLDNAATTYPKPECVYEEMDRVNRELAFNAGRGSYSSARAASAIIDDTRKKLLELVHGTGAESVVLTASATEALNTIIQGIDWHNGDLVYISPYEHNAVARSVELIRKKCGIRVELLPIMESTMEIDLDKISYLFVKNKPKCICCTHVSNVTGYILPVKEIFETAHSVGAITVLDASQSMGLVDIDISTIHADFIAFAGHKTLYGPFGIGGFIDVNDVPLSCFMAGGTGSDSLNLDMPYKTPDKYESGSKNIVAIAGLLASLKILDVHEIRAKEVELTRYLISEMNKLRNVHMYYCDDLSENHVGILSFNINGYTSEEVGTILSDEFDIAVRTGFHCAPYIHELLGDKEMLGTVRIGMGKFNTKEEIDSLIDAINSIN